MGRRGRIRSGGATCYRTSHFEGRNRGFPCQTGETQYLPVLRPDRSTFLDPSSSSSWVSDNLPGSRAGQRDTRQCCPLGNGRGERLQWTVGHGELPGVHSTNQTQSSASLLPRKEEEDPPLLHVQRRMCTPRSQLPSSHKVWMASSQNFQRAVGFKQGPEEGGLSGSHCITPCPSFNRRRKASSDEISAGRAIGFPAREISTRSSWRTRQGGESKALSFKRFPSGFIPGWTLYNSQPIRLCGGVEGPAPSADRKRRRKRRRIEEEGATGRDAGISRCDSGQSRGREAAEEDEITKQLTEKAQEEKEEGPRSLKLRRRRRGLRRKLFIIIDSSSEAEITEETGISFSTPGRASTGATGTSGQRAERLTGRHHRPALHLLPGGAQTATGPEEPRHQGDCNASQVAGSFEVRATTGIGRHLGGEVDCGGSINQARLVRGTTFGGLPTRRRQRDSTTPAIASATACEAGRQSWRKRILGKDQHIWLGCLGKRYKTKRQGQGPQRKRKERQREGQKHKGKLEQLGGREQRQAPRSKGETGCMSGAMNLRRGDFDFSSSAGCEDIVVHDILQLQDGSATFEGIAGLPVPARPDTDEGGHGKDEEPNASGPQSPQEWLTVLEGCTSIALYGVVLAWGWMKGFVDLLGRPAEPSQSTRASGSTRGLFPLPVCYPEGVFWQSFWRHRSADHESMIQCWIGNSCNALNRYYGFHLEPPRSRRGKVHAAIELDMRDKIGRFLSTEVPVGFSYEDVIVELKERKISYTGEEIVQPSQLSVEQIIRGLPPKGHGGKIPLIPFLRGRARFFWNIRKTFWKIHVKEVPIPTKLKFTS